MTKIMIDLDFKNIVVLLPAKNEAHSVQKVISDFKQALPNASVVLCDNDSKDNTAELAKLAGASVTFEANQGKANAVSRLFYENTAEVYLIVDCDDTYDAFAAPYLVKEFFDRNLDLLIVSRISEEEGQAFPPLHRLGNKFFTTMFQFLFNSKIDDVLSGYRILSKRFVKSLPIMSEGFQIEMEMTAIACACNYSVGTSSAVYRARAEGSESKLRTFRDGLKILIQSLILLIDYRPLFTFFSVGGFLCLLSVIMFFPIWLEYKSTGLVERFPTAILCVGLVLLGFMSFQLGIILNGVTRMRIEAIKLTALSSKFLKETQD